MKLPNGTVVVTGGCSGIGRAVVDKITEMHRAVAVLDIAPLPTELAALGVHHVTCDVGSRESVFSAFASVNESLGEIGAVAGCAGVGGAGARLAILDDHPDLAESIVHVNLLGQYWVLEASATYMGRRDRMRSIVLVSSVLGRRAMPELGAYSAAKAGVERLSEAAALEFADLNIRVNAVAPGPILTPMSQSALTRGGKTELEGIERLASLVALNRMGQPSEVADAIIFLMSENASYVTGTSFTVDGGSLR